MISRLASHSAVVTAARATRSRVQAVAQRTMGGGGRYMKISPAHTFWGEVFGVICWVWVFHRARHDLPVVLGYRHPWDHVEDPFAVAHDPPLHPDDKKDFEAEWDNFVVKASNPGEDDDEDEENEEDDDDE